MKDLEEAIAHAEEVANNPSTCAECAAEHLQLAGWLKELKMYREQNTNTAP